VIVNDTVFLVAADQSLLLFSQESATPFSPTAIPVQDGGNQHFLNEKSVFKMTAFYESLFRNLGTVVVTLQIFMSNDGDDYFLLVGYDNGSIGVLSLGDDFLDSRGFATCNRTPSLLLVFPAHTPQPSSPFSPVAFQRCPWSTVPGSVYTLEFYTIGNDFKISHWGLRGESMNQTLEFRSQPAMQIDHLGVRSLLIDSTYFPSECNIPS
jgi:hypothetical protein